MTGAPGPEGLAAEARSADVVVFRSGLTDVRTLRSWLDEHRIRFREVEMPMGSGEQRARFHALQEVTGWRTLPQVFLHGEFVGGEQELVSAVSGQASVQDAASSARAVSPTIRFLGYAGLLPFVAGALALGIATEWALAAGMERLLLGYGAVILSFLGAIHWGRVLQPRRPAQADGLAVYGVVPSILAWATLALPFGMAAPLQAMLLVLVYWVDRAAFSGSEVPAGFISLRLHLTGVAVVSILAAWTSVMFHGGV